MRTAVLLCTIAWSLCCAAAVHAELTVTDLQVAARALSFMESPPSGTLRVGILFSPSAGSTRDQAEEARALLRGGLRVGNLTLEPVVLRVADATTANIDLLLLTENMGGHGDAVRRLAKERQLTCITTDLERVRDGTCALGIRSAPKVEILVHRKSASDSGTAFATAFRVMITEL